MTNWDDQRFFLALAREVSIKKASEKLGVNRSTVLRRITALEKDLGVRLFERMPNGYFTTGAGKEMKQLAERMEDVANEGARRLAGKDDNPRGAIRVSVSGALAAYVLMPEIASFSTAYPDIRLEIQTSYAMPDLARREADVAIRISNDPPEDLVGRRVVKIARATYVGAQLLQQQDAAEALDKLSWIGWSVDETSRQWLEDSDYPDAPVSMVITNPFATVKAVRAGMGMTILPCFMADSEPGLYRMPPGRTHSLMDLWVLTHSDLRNTARIRLFTEFMGKALVRHRDLLEGKCPRKLPANHS